MCRCGACVLQVTAGKGKRQNQKSAGRVRGWKMVSFSEGGCDELSGTIVDGARGGGSGTQGIDSRLDACAVRNDD